MKKIIALGLVMAMLVTGTFTLNGCCCFGGLSEDVPSLDDITNDIVGDVAGDIADDIIGGNDAVAQKSPFEKLEDYITENGTYYEGSYVVSESGDDSYFSMSVEDGSMYWYYSYSDSDMIVEIVEDASSLDFLYECTVSSSSYQVSGSIYPSTYSISDPTVYSISTDAPSYLDSSLQTMCESFSVMLFLQAKLTLLETGVSASDLGFSNL